MVPTSDTGAPDKLPASHDDSEIIVPLHIEEAFVSKRQVETGRVRVSTVTRQHEQLIEEVLTRQEVQVERRAVNQPVDRIPAVREEGDTIIVPIVEEVLVVERKLMLKEEVHIKRVHGTEPFQQKILLRKQEAVVERIQAATSDINAGTTPGVTLQPK